MERDRACRDIEEPRPHLVPRGEKANEVARGRRKAAGGAQRRHPAAGIIIRKGR